jgi:hypothetical protein
VLDSAVVGRGSYLRSDKIGQDYFDQLSSVSLFVNALGGVQAGLGEWRSIEQFSFGSTTSNAPVCEIAWQRSSLPTDRFQRFIGEIETSITAHLAAEPEGTDRDTDDALADLWSLSHENDPPVGLLRGRIKALPSCGLHRSSLPHGLRGSLLDKGASDPISGMGGDCRCAELDPSNSSSQC